MNILIPVLGFAPAGGNRVLSNLATEWVNLGHTVTFLSPEGGGPVYFPTQAAIDWLNADGNAVATPDYSQKSLEPKGFTICMKKAIEKKAKDYDIILLNHCYTAWPALLAGMRQKCFYYIQLHEPELYWSNSISIYQKMKVLTLWATYFLFPKSRCFVNSDMYVGYKGIRSSAPIIYPGISLDLYWAKDDAPIMNKIVFGIIGRKEPWKGCGQAVDALRLMIKKGWDVRLRVAFGNLPEGLLDGIEEYVEIVMPENDKELADFYRSVDIMLTLGTIQHGAPHYPVLESMACGTLVITTGYFPADKETSYIVPENDSEAVAEVVKIIMHEDDSVIRHKIHLAREKVMPLSWGVLASKMINYIEQERN